MENSVGFIRFLHFLEDSKLELQKVLKFLWKKSMHNVSISLSLIFLIILPVIFPVGLCATSNNFFTETPYFKFL
jgi:hypothetical protein